VEEVDWSVGRVLDTLRELNLAEKTLVLFTSDNGGTPRAVNTPLRGFKGSVLEGGMREPTIAWWPGRIAGGTTCDALTTMMDVLPTFVKLACGKIPADRKLDGYDIWPLLIGQTKDTSYEAFYYYRGVELQAVRQGPWKLHLAKGQLYNLDTDIGESKDVAKDNAEVVAKLESLADQMKLDLGRDVVGPGCRPMGKVANAQSLFDHEGNIREGFTP
jgi:arylsulfatase A-like enzyme